MSESPYIFLDCNFVKLLEETGLGEPGLEFLGHRGTNLGVDLKKALMGVSTWNFSRYCKITKNVGWRDCA